MIGTRCFAGWKLKLYRNETTYLQFFMTRLMRPCVLALVATFEYFTLLASSKLKQNFFQLFFLVDPVNLILDWKFSAVTIALLRNWRVIYEYSGTRDLEIFIELFVPTCRFVVRKFQNPYLTIQLRIKNWSFEKLIKSTRFILFSFFQFFFFFFLIW